MTRNATIYLLAAVLSAGCACANPFASTVVEYHPGPGQFVNDPNYNVPERCLGAPIGGMVNLPDNSSIATLGDGGWITLAFSEPVYDDPRNPYGLDFIVFSNAQYIGVNPNLRWQELAYVEISQDGDTWYLIKPSILPAELTGGVDTGESSTVVSGYAEYSPTLDLPSGSIRTASELYTVPDRQAVLGVSSLIATDTVSGGGDGMDIAAAVVRSSMGVPALDSQGHMIPAGINWFRFVRIVDALVGDTSGDMGEISAEIDAVSDICPASTIGEAKGLSAGSYAVITDAIVTAKIGSDVYIESSDRSAAMRMVTSKSVSVGSAVTVTGHISRTDGRFSFTDPMFTATATGGAAPAPLGIAPRSLGSARAYGLRIRTWGKVTSNGTGYCVIEDGGSSAKLTWTASYDAPAIGAYVSACGICDREGGSGATIVRLTDPANDITVY